MNENVKDTTTNNKKKTVENMNFGIDHNETTAMAQKDNNDSIVI